MTETKKSSYKTVGQCRCCGSDKLTMYLDLGAQPLANSYVRNLSDPPQEKFPLQVYVCENCWHSQLSIVVDPDLMFKNYLYVSGTSKTLQNYFYWFANKVSKDASSVLDIACNDQSQLDVFKRLGLETYGVDPAKNLFEDNKNKKHNIMCDYWNLKISDRIRNYYIPEIDLIIAQNVFAHTDDLNGFLIACKAIMHDKSRLYIQVSQKNMISNMEFDTIYHEHLSYFSILSMKTICEQVGLIVTDLFEVPIHGVSSVFEIMLCSTEKHSQDKVQYGLLHERIDKRLHELDTYIRFGTNAKKIINDLDLVNHIDSTRFVGVGASAKGNTVLNSSNLQLHYIIDDNPNKWNLYSPGKLIPIKPTQFIATETNDIVFVLLTWNFADEMIKNIKHLRPHHNDKFLRYFPKVEFI